MPTAHHTRVVAPGEFEQQHHYYPRVLNAQIHSAVAYFLALDPQRLVKRYCHMNPKVAPKVLSDILSYRPKYFAWAGADLLHVTTAGGKNHMVVIETNSCPSGQKSMPLYHEAEETGGYRRLIEQTFLPMVAARRLPAGGLAVIYDKNRMEASGYAATLAELAKEPVHLVPFHDEDPDPDVRFSDGIMEVRVTPERWQPIRAAFRYVTQRPWNRIPVTPRTLIFNPIIACLSGGRNKLLAAKAYDLFNAELAGSGLHLSTPETIWDVRLHQIPLWVQRLGGLAVIKTPYSNAGQGVHTITSPAELESFMALEHHYDQFIVQSLIGNFRWSSESRAGRLYHVGTMPDKHGRIFVADLRMMVGAGQQSFHPLAIYGRRAKAPLADKLTHLAPSWDMLGTNLSSRLEDGGWATDTTRLLLMDRKDYNVLGLGLDDIIEAFIQTVLATIAIDKMADNLITKKGRFRSKLFASFNDDPVLIEEICS